jgi:hypothetical protein
MKADAFATCRPCGENRVFINKGNGLQCYIGHLAQPELIQAYEASQQQVLTGVEVQPDVREHNRTEA